MGSSSELEMTPERLRQIEELYHAARSDRGVLAGVGSEIRIEVEGLLAHDRIPLPAFGATLTEDPLDQSRTSMVAVGSQLGRYKIESVLGEGGMGKVFGARDTRLSRLVAIKL